MLNPLLLGDATDSVRDQMMRHEPGFKTFCSAYLNEIANFDLQNAFLEEERTKLKQGRYRFEDLCVLCLSAVASSCTKITPNIVAKVISSGCSGARCEEHCLALCVAKTANPGRIQRAVIAIELHNEQPVEFDPALPALGAFPPQRLLQDIALIPPYSQQQVPNYRIIGYCYDGA